MEPRGLKIMFDIKHVKLDTDFGNKNTAFN